MLTIRLLASTGLLGVSALALWAALRSRQRNIQIASVTVAVASILLVYLLFYKPAGVTKPDIAPGTLEEEPYE